TLRSAEGARFCLFRVWHDVDEVIGVALDAEVEAPAERHAGLPNVARLVVLLSVQRRVTDVGNQEGNAAVEGISNHRGSALVTTAEALRVPKAHYAFFTFFTFFRACSEWTSSLAESNGPYTRP